jgi:hypothetical protein
MEDVSSTVGVGLGGGLIGVIIYVIFKYCYKKKLHSVCKSGCCETTVDVGDNSTPTNVPGVNT